jgi:hypothetical protein
MEQEPSSTQITIDSMHRLFVSSSMDKLKFLKKKDAYLRFKYSREGGSTTEHVIDFIPAERQIRLYEYDITLEGNIENYLSLETIEDISIINKLDTLWNKASSSAIHNVNYYCEPTYIASSSMMVECKAMNSKNYLYISRSDLQCTSQEIAIHKELYEIGQRIIYGR